MPDSRPSYAETLKRVPLFADLSEKEMAFLATRASRHRYRTGDIIFSDGEPARGLYVVESGVVRFFKASAGGREQVLAVIGPENTVGELAVFEGADYPASAAALSDASLLFLSKEDFRALCRQHPDVALKVLQAVGARLRRMIGVIEQLSFTTVRQRLAALLLQLARRRGKRTPRGIEFTLVSSHQDLAAHIGSVRELVSRNLSRLQTAGIIRIKGKTVLIPNLQALEAEARKGL